MIFVLVEVNEIVVVEVVRIVVDLGLNVKGVVEMEVVMEMFEEGNDVCEGMVGEVEDVCNMLILWSGKVVIWRRVGVDGRREIIGSVRNGLYVCELGEDRWNV